MTAITHDDPPDAVIAYGRQIVDALTTVAGAALEGVYVHGSAALGGFIPARSDVDILAVVNGPIDQGQAARALHSAAGDCPGTGLEMSIITTATARSLGDCSFELHLTTNPADTKTVLGRHHPGDPDLVLHVVVCRHHGIALTGPPARHVFGPVAHHRVLDAMADELRWSLTHATEAYAVLNACRALRYLDEGVICSKLDAGHWALHHHRHVDQLAVIARAIDLHTAGALQLPPPDAQALVDHVVRALTRRPHHGTPPASC
jgi:streptomycin 3"-adenylyltransferase